jgi:hypothetical protein
MLKYKRLVLLFAALALIDLAALPRAASASGCMDTFNAPGCMDGLPADQYQTLLAAIGAHPAPPVHPLPVDEAMVLRYSDTRSKPARMASRFAGVTFDAPPALPMAWILRTTRPHVLPKIVVKPLPKGLRVTHIYKGRKVKRDGRAFRQVQEP